MTSMYIFELGCNNVLHFIFLGNFEIGKISYFCSVVSLLGIQYVSKAQLLFTFISTA